MSRSDWENIVIKTSGFLVAAALALTACDGTVPPPALLPSASIGYATAANNVQGQNQGVTFVNGPQLVAFAPGGSSLSRTDLRISNAVANDGKIEVTVDGTPFVAHENLDLAGNVISYTGSNGSKTFNLFPMASETYAVLNGIAVADSAGGPGLSGYSAMGFVTSPTTISGKGAVPSSPNAFATYSGNSFANVYKNNGLTASNSGNLFVAVDFVNSSFAGSMDLNQSQTAGPINLWFSDGKINGHMMTATVGINVPAQVGMQSGVQPSSQLTGSFFGPDAENVAGQFNLTGTSNDVTPQNVVVQGGFIGKK